MTNLMLRPTFTPNLFQDLFDFRRNFDRMFDRFFSTWPWASDVSGTESIAFVPPVEACLDQDTKQYRVQVHLPGIDPNQVKVEVQGNLLTISGERQATRQSQNIDYLAQEVTYGSFERTLSLPEGVQADKLAAEYHNGVLTITAPVAASVLPRRIEIKGLPAAAKKAA
ncbi:MAG TPA: Hsp20/alpha crystallin family protein [Candidatus Xenobia bacterium]|nr:Hsp20/alpha crystallin family protein [Candidatus Xenobia bacterium]